MKQRKIFTSLIRDFKLQAFIPKLISKLMFHLCISLSIAISVILRLAQLTFIFICCHFNICVELIVNQQVKRPQPMTAVTGKFVLKCRTTNIATLFDISLFYVFKYYFIYFYSILGRNHKKHYICTRMLI